MSLFAGFNISASGMTAQRVRLDAIANNLANAETTRTAQGGPYRRQVPIFAPREPLSFFPSFLQPLLRDQVSGGVRVVGLTQDPAPSRMVYDPDHPDAGIDGYVAYPNVNVVLEMTDLIAASRAYEANATVFSTFRTMANRVLEIGR